MPVVTFDAAKRAANLAKHGIDLADCESVFDFPMLTIEDSREAYGEQRLKSLGWLADRVVVGSRCGPTPDFLPPW